MTFHDLKLRLRALLAPRRVERELDEELAFHVERETAKLVEQGVAPTDARQQALARFGSVALAADECRDARGLTFIDHLARDLAFALRTFRRAPLPALTIVGTISLGLGMAAVAFSFYDALVFRTDAVPHPEALFEVRRPPTPGDRVWMAFTGAQYETLRRDTDAFSGVAAELPQINARLDGQPIYGSLVTSNYFQVLGAAAAAGRTFVEGEREPVVVLSHRAWRRLFDEDETVVGRTVQLNGQRFGVLGVMPEGFRGLQSLAPPDYWAPLDRLADFRPGD